MTNKEFLNQLVLKLRGSDARIKDLEQQVSQLTMKLVAAEAKLKAAALDKLAKLDAYMIDTEVEKD